jgi:hypothetical protein
MSNSNQDDAVAKMVDTITLVTGSEQIKAMTEEALEAIEGGAGGDPRYPGVTQSPAVPVNPGPYGNQQDADHAMST